MKTMKNGVFAALTVVLLLTAALITNCNSPIISDGFTEQGEKPGFIPPPPGKGYVSLNFGGSKGRTIMPAAIANINAANFVAFVVNMENTDSSSTETPVTDQVFQASGAGATAKTALENLTEARFLVTDKEEYSIRVDAYTTFTAIATSTIAATWSDEIVMDGPSNPVDVELAAIITGGGTGTFKYNLTYGGAANFGTALNSAVSGNNTTGTVASMSFTQISAGASKTAISLLTAPADTTGTLMTVGVYRVSVALASGKTLEDDDEQYQADTRTWILHIYQGMESLFDEDLTALRSLVHPIGFDTLDGATVINVKYLHSELFDDRYPAAFNGGSGSKDPINDTDPLIPFYAWYPVDDSSNDWESPEAVAVDIGTDRVFYPHTLYARWVEAAKANMTVTFSLTDPANPMTLSPDTISQAAFKNPGLTLTVSDAPAGATFAWKYDNVALSSTSNSAGVPYTENAAGWNRITPGPHFISLEITVGGYVYSKEFEITVTAP